eukprot:Em0007g966a
MTGVTTRAQKKKEEKCRKDLESLEDIQIEDGMSADERFEILEELGGGAYGKVYKARDKGRGGEIVAVKKVCVREERDIGIPPFVMREVANLKRLSTPAEQHIVRLLDVHSTEGRYEHDWVFYLVFEHMERDLECFIAKCPPPGMNENVIKDFLGQILSGVDWMHVNTIVHRDIKPQNILVSSDGKQLKIADFGLSRSIGSNVILSTEVVTQWYRAPEVLLHSSYNKEVDIWSVGCVFAEMIIGKPLFAAERKGEKPQLDKIFSIIGTPTKNEWPTESSITSDQFFAHTQRQWSDLVPEASEQAQDLLAKMLKFMPHERTSARSALKHEYFHQEHSEGYHSPGSMSTCTSSSWCSQSSSSDSCV